MGQLGDLSPQGSVAIGILVGLLSTSIQSLGLTLQRKSHLLEDEKDDYETRRPPYKRRRWQLGMAMFVTSNLVGSTIQITTLPLPVLSTLQASGLVFNTAFATLLLKEPFTRFSLIGTVLTCTGAALIAIFGAIGEPAHSLSQLLDLLWQRQFIVWMVATLAVVVGTILFAHVLKVYSSQKHFEQSLAKMERSQSMSPTTTFRRPRKSFSASLPPQLQLRVSRLRVMRGLSYALISGILSAHSLLVAKSAVELIVRTIVDHNNQFNRFQSWLILLALLFFALAQLYYLHLGLRLCSTSVLYPFVFCIYNIIAILDGLIYFRQASRLSGLHAGLIAVGTVILLSGVLALSWRLDDTTPSDLMASSQTLPTQTSLTPGMGLIPTEESERSPLLPTTRNRSSTSASRKSMDEFTPLLYRRPHRGSIYPAPLETDPKVMWDELNDAEQSSPDQDEDILASLPRAPSPYLTRDFSRYKRRRGDSASSLASKPNNASNSSPNLSKRKRDSAGSEDSIQYLPPRRRGNLQKGADGDIRRSSAPSGFFRVHKNQSAGPSPAPSPLRRASPGVESSLRDPENNVEQAAEEERNRQRSTSAGVRFADQVVPSRWDVGVRKFMGGKADGKGKEEGDDPGG